MATMPETKLTPTPVKSLHFDRSNPRLAEYGVSTETTEDDILDILWDAMDVMELVQSIAASGFFPHEALVVSREHNKNIVIVNHASQRISWHVHTRNWLPKI